MVAVIMDGVGIPCYGFTADEEHNRLRREIFAKICQDIARVQFDVDG
jgi:hypothetical protein